MMEQKDANDFSWDLSCHLKQEDNSETEVLDLSRKNLMTPPTTKGTNTTACLSPSSPAHINNQHSSLPNPEKQNPFANIVLLSSSSELDSPREPTDKCEPCFYNVSNEVKKNISYRLFQPPSVTMGVPFLCPFASKPLHLNSETLKIPTVTTTITSTTTSLSTSSYTESSVQANAGTRLERLRQELMNGSSAQIEMSTPSLDVVKKTPRPFKVYSKNPFPILKKQIDYCTSSNYLEYRENVLKYRKMHESAPNPKMRRTTKSPGLPTSTADEKNAAYLEKRKKNNEAAKRSRDNRRAKEDELAIFATFLQEENTQLRNELAGALYVLQQMGYDISQFKKNSKFC
ncbi:uncharacterized protein Gt [Anoplolepis gracilipes]|uniref:uncharacterized protein Gt n=1 Tax=Anoplolepis gracilipes TaxID=354296 RepID=UPI003BA037EE